jgi:hypothetical protein
LNKVIFIVLFAVSFSVLLGSQNAFALTETVFDEDFDGALVGWSESLCNLNNPPTQVCRLDQATTLFDPPNELPNSLPNWGFVEIEANGGEFIPVEVRYAKSFNVVNEDDYTVSSWLGVKDCSGLGDCHIASRIFVDGFLILEQSGPDVSDEPLLPSHVFFEQSTFHLTSGPHMIELGMLSPEGAIAGNFRASFDNVLIQREVPVQVVGGTIIPIDTTALLLANIQSTTWMIPIVLSIVGIGLFVVSRKSENS